MNQNNQDSTRREDEQPAGKPTRDPHTGSIHPPKSPYGYATEEESARDPYGTHDHKGAVHHPYGDPPYGPIGRFESDTVDSGEEPAEDE